MSSLIDPNYLQKIKRRPSYVANVVIPSLDYDRIPNINDMVQLTDDNYGMIVELFFDDKKSQNYKIIYHVKLYNKV